jgi:hypothetical protein
MPLATLVESLQSRLDPFGQRSEIGNALQFVIRKLHAKVMFKLRQQVQGLQTVNPECLEKIIVGRKFFSRHFKVCRSKIQYLVQGLVGRLHNLSA